MKARILVGALCLSLLVNIAGIFFFVAFLVSRGQNSHLRHERNELARNLTVIRGQGVADETVDGSPRVYRRTFYSQLDGNPDVFGLLPPAAATSMSNVTLVVYLHGMGSSYIEPFVSPADKSVASAITALDPNVVVISPSYRGTASWGSDAAMLDITQNIREVMQEFPIKRIVLMGTSMGGCTVLSYAAEAPKDIRDKLVGIVSVESAGDLASLYKETKVAQVQDAMVQAFKGTPEQNPQAYAFKSVLSNLDKFPTNVHVAIISAKQDNIVPPDLQKQTLDALNARHIPVKLIEVDGGHGCPPGDIYVEGYKFAAS